MNHDKSYGQTTFNNFGEKTEQKKPAPKKLKLIRSSEEVMRFSEPPDMETYRDR